MAEIYHELHVLHNVSISKQMGQNSWAVACAFDKRENKLSPFGSGSDPSGSQDAGGCSSPGTNAMCSMFFSGSAREESKVNTLTGNALNLIRQRTAKCNICSCS